MKIIAKNNNREDRWLSKQRLSAAGFLVLFVTSLFIFSATSFIKPLEAKAGPQYDLSKVALPPISTTDEYGIWVDRTQILLFNAKIAGGGQKFIKKADEEKNAGDLKYYDTTVPERKITVHFDTTESTPKSGTFSYVGGGTVNIKLLNEKASVIDGYLYSNKEMVDMPVYLGGIEGCGNLQGGALLKYTNGKYRSNGTFKKSGSSYKLQTDGSVVVEKVQSGNDKVKAWQKKTSDCSTAGSKTLSFAGGEDGGRDIFLLVGYQQKDVVDAAKTAIDGWRSKKGRSERLAKYFETSSPGKTAMEKCKQGSGQRGSTPDLIALLVDIGENVGQNPFVDCMLRELAEDSDFKAALQYTYEGDYTGDLQDDNSGANCSNAIGIPIIGDLICGLVRLIFDMINNLFTTVISYFGSTDNTFDTFKNSSQIKSAWSGLRNLASILFVIAFFMVILQYLTNINVVDAYFVKKFIPRLVVAIILVQASFWLVSEMNYITSDLGASIQSLLFYSASGSTSHSAISLDTGGSFIANNFGAFIIFGPAAPGVAVILGIVLALILVLAIVILSIRQLVLIVLAILAPLALACVAIPQLEGTAKKWLNMYIKALMMYPIMMLFISVGAVVGNILNQMGGFFALMGFIAYFLPFILLPFSFKMAGGVMGTVAAKVNGMAKKGVKYGAGKGKEAYGRTDFAQDKAAKKKYKESERGDAAQRRLNSRAATGRLGRYKLSSEQQAIAEARTLQDALREPAAQQAARKAQSDAAGHRVNESILLAKENEMARARATGTTPDTSKAANEAAQRILETSTNEHERASAASFMIGNGGEEQLEAAITTMQSTPAGSANWEQTRNDVYGELSEKRADLAAPPGKTFLDVASTTKKQSTQKPKGWESGFRQDALGTMAAHDTVSKSTDAVDLTMSRSDAAKHVAEQVNTPGAVDLTNAHLDHLYTAHTALEDRLKGLGNDPNAAHADILDTQKAINSLEAEIVKR